MLVWDDLGNQQQEQEGQHQPCGWGRCSCWHFISSQNSIPPNTAAAQLSPFMSLFTPSPPNPSPLGALSKQEFIPRRFLICVLLWLVLLVKARAMGSAGPGCSFPPLPTEKCQC